MNFDIGEIPKGWKRGDELRVVQIPRHLPHGRGAIMHAGPYDMDGPVPEIGAVTFTVDMADKVNAWLKWWRGS